MALHTQLPIYRAAEGLLDVVTDVVTNMQRDFKRSVGEKISTECIEIIVLVYRANVTAFLPAQLGARINPRKTILQPIDRGVDFVGQVIKPWRRETRKRTRNEALRRVAETPSRDLMPVANSYFGLLRQATANHHDRACLANLLRSLGKAVDRNLTKTF